MKYYYKASKIC